MAGAKQQECTARLSTTSWQAAQRQDIAGHTRAALEADKEKLTVTLGIYGREEGARTYFLAL